MTTFNSHFLLKNKLGVQFNFINRKLKWSLEHKVLFKGQLSSTGTRRRKLRVPQKYSQIKNVKGAPFFNYNDKAFIKVPVILYLLIVGWFSLEEYILLQNSFARAENK